MFKPSDSPPSLKVYAWALVYTIALAVFLYFTWRPMPPAWCVSEAAKNIMVFEQKEQCQYEH